MSLVTPAGPLREQLIPLLERKRMIDGAWIVCLVVVLGAVTLPWFLRVLDVDLARVAACVFVYALLHVSFATMTDRLDSASAVSMGLRVMLLSSVVFLAFLWHLVGGVENPMFLATFTLPVIMSGILLIGAQAQITAAVSVLLVAAVSLVESPDLRWYVARFHGPWIARVAAAVGSVFPQVHAFSGVETSPAYEFTLLETFAAVQLTVAFLSRPLAVLLVRVNSRLDVSTKLLTEVQGLFHAVLRAEPDPVVIIYADSGQLVQASDSFFKRMLVRPSELTGKGLFEVVQFDEPERVRGALVGQSGELSFCVYRVQGEARIATLYFHRTEHEGTAYIYVGWQELTELYHLQAAFNAVDDPLVVVRTDSRLQYANRRARELFGDLYFGMDITTVPKLCELLDEPSDPAETEDGRDHRVIDDRPYDLHRLSAQLPGDISSCTILWLHCVAKEEALFEQAVRDPLTGIYNRRYFDDALARHVARSKLGRKLACAYFDLDDFKTINDQGGHAAGDAALVGFVETVKSQLRAVDIFARLGGDEFAVLFVNCDTQVASTAISRIRAILQSEGWTFEGHKRHLSFSAGLAACRPDDDVERLLQRTDRAVYAAKAGGKGRCVADV